jgi:tetratricopeptide (TPR) repeat protein
MNSGRLPREQFYIGYFNRASAYRRAGDFDKALADLDKVVKLNPDFAPGWQYRGLAHDAMGSKHEALSDLDRAIDVDSRDWSGYYSRAIVQRYNKEFDAALDDLKEAARLDPDNPQIDLLAALLRADKGEFEAAKREIDDIVAQGKDDAAAYYARAEVAFVERRLDDATDDVNKALDHRRSFLAAEALKGRIFEARGEKAEAEARYRKVLDMPVDYFSSQASRKMANERLKALTGKDTDNVALNHDTQDVGCKRFLPATGMIITASCED